MLGELCCSADSLGPSIAMGHTPYMLAKLQQI
jgi:hypothetical protein